MSVRRIKYLAVFIFIITLLSGCSLFPKEEEILKPPLVEPVDVEYTLYEVQRGDLVKQIRGAGTVVSVKQHYLMYKDINGRLKSINVSLGDEIEAGTVVAELDEGNLLNQIQQQEISLQKLRLGYQQLLNSAESYQLDKKLYEMNLENAKIQYEINPIKANKDALERAKIELEKLQKQIENYSYNIEKYKLDIKSAELKLEELKKSYEKTKLVSPVSGTVVYVANYNEGDYVQSYRTIVKIADPDNLQIIYTSNDLREFEVGMEVELEYKDIKFKGKVVQTPSTAPADASDKEKNSVIISAETLPEEVEMGDLISFRIITEKRENVIVVPRQAVRNYMGRNYVLIYEDGKQKERDVEKGLETPTEVEIVKGLKEGEKIILR